MYSQPNSVIDERVRGNEELQPVSGRRDRPVSIDVTEYEGDRTGIRSQADGGIVTQLRLDHSSLFLRPTLRRATDVTVEPEYWTTVGAGRTLIFCSVSGDSFEDFESALELDPTVTDPVLADRYPGRRVYRVELTDRAVTFIAATAEVGGRLLDLSSSRDGWRVQLQFPTRDDLVSFNDRCRDRDISVTVDHLRLSDDEDDCVVALTEKQEELLAVAHEEGYFDVPRGISQDELADRLGVSKSAVSQRLRRAIGELCASKLC